MKKSAPKSGPQSAPPIRRPAAAPSASSLCIVEGRLPRPATTPGTVDDSDEAVRLRLKKEPLRVFRAAWVVELQTVKVAIGCLSCSLMPGHRSRPVVRTRSDSSRRGGWQGGYTANTSRSFASCSSSRCSSGSARRSRRRRRRCGSCPGLPDDSTDERAGARGHLVANAVDEVVVDPDIAHQPAEHPCPPPRPFRSSGRGRSGRTASPRRNRSAPLHRSGCSARAGPWASSLRPATTRSPRREP